MGRSLMVQKQDNSKDKKRPVGKKTHMVSGHWRPLDNYVYPHLRKNGKDSKG